MIACPSFFNIPPETNLFHIPFDFLLLTLIDSVAMETTHKINFHHILHTGLGKGVRKQIDFAFILLSLVTSCLAKDTWRGGQTVQCYRHNNCTFEENQS